MNKRYLLLILLFCFVTASRNSAQETCPGGLMPRLAIGELGQVTPGAANNVRAQPSRSAELVGKMQAGQVFTTLDGPECADGFTWWQVQFYDDGQQAAGWTVESNSSAYFVEPLTGKTVRFEGISFLLPTEAVDDATGVMVEAIKPTRDKPWENYPAYVEFTFTGYPDEQYRLEYDFPSLKVYKVTAFDGIENMLGDAGRYAIEGAAKILKERPDLYSFGVIRSRIPDDRPGAANIVLAQMRYLDFQNGSGYRYITAYAQDFVAATNERLTYRYLGLTADGQYFVSAWFPIDSPELPEAFEPQSTADDPDGFGAFQKYASASAELFDSISPEAYTPDLSKLDALIASLLVTEG